MSFKSAHDKLNRAYFVLILIARVLRAPLNHGDPNLSLIFFRVQPYVSLNYLRDHIEEQLGADVVPEDYVFLRSVGRCMAVVSLMND